MAGSNLTKFTAFANEDQAIALLESIRWPNGAACPHCGGCDPYRIVARKIGTRTRKGLWKCSQCRKQFTVKVGTIFEQSHIPVSKWLMAIHLLTASKKGMSAHQFHRMLGITYRAAWFMAHRLRHAMAQDDVLSKLTGVIEADETYVGGKRWTRWNKQGERRGNPSRRADKIPVFGLVQRNGQATMFPVERVTAENMRRILTERVDLGATLMTDESNIYTKTGRKFGKHGVVKHAANEYVKDGGFTHTNTVEGFFSLLKRGIMGTFHHVSKGHLHRYCDEFSFRYNNRIAAGVDDAQRAKNLILAGEGKRLTFKQPSSASAA
jgi:transposase-like protein